MGKAHSNAYRQAGRYFDLPYDLKLQTICGRSETPLKEAADQFGWESIETDWRKVVDDPAIDVIDVSTPGDSHREIATAAAAAGKTVWCEKPLGNSLSEAEDMYDAVVRAKVHHGVFHNYRKAPAVALARNMVSDGLLGDIRHFRAVYLQDWIADPSFPLVWRLRKEHSGSGALGDIGSHIIDLGRHLVGEFSEVCGSLKTFVGERPITVGSSETGAVTVDDAAIVLAKFSCGAIGTLEATRFAIGRRNYNSFEINGSKGSIVFNLERMNELQYCNAADPDDLSGFRLIQVTASSHPFAGQYWPAGHIIGYEHTFINWVVDATHSLSRGETCSPNFHDGLENQRVLDAVERSHLQNKWISITPTATPSISGN